MATPSREARKQRANQAKAERLKAARRRRQTKALTVVLIIVLIFGGSFGALQLLDGDDSASDTPQDTTDITSAPTATTIPGVPAGETIAAPTPCPATDGSQARASSFAAAPTLCIDPAKTYTAKFDTNQGVINVALDTATVPNTVNNFVVLSRYKYYDGSAIVRTNAGEGGIDIIQGGAPTTQTNSDPGPGYTIQDEGGPFTYTDGDLVMANTGQPNSSGGQWFFGAGPGVSNLDSQGTYLKLGKAADQASLDVLHTILALHAATDPSNPTEGAPSTPVIVNSITITEA